MSGCEQKADLLIGAGHRTHWSLLLYKRLTGAPAVVLMKPSLPLSWFDLCLIPRHDAPVPHPNVIVTEGALNPMQPGESQQGRAIILIGGPSKHFGWNDEQLISQLTDVVNAGGSWLLTTSRRTPDSFLQTLADARLKNVEVVPFESTGPGWLAERLSEAPQCWVSGDSVSMVFEALTAGCAVGILELPVKSANRITRGLQFLIDDKKVMPFSDWQPQTGLPLPVAPLDEATRCAKLIKEKLL